jgi:hypothetical protein
MSKARIAKVIWAVPDFAEGEAKTLSEALEEIRKVRQRLLFRSRAYIVMCRKDGTQDRIEV